MLVKKISLVVICISIFSCSWSPHKYNAGSDELKRDRDECEVEYAENFERSGMFYYRNKYYVIRDCMKKRGWKY